MSESAVQVTDVYEAPRGCGRRQPGGKYLVSAGECVPCGRLPIPLDRCPTCSCGIKASRGWTWIDLRKLLERAPECETTAVDLGRGRRGRECTLCPLGPNGPQRVGLLWVGSVFYPTTGEFMREAAAMGISRRISQIPRGFEVGKTWVVLAHRRPEPHGFTIFRPQRIDYVVRSDDSPEKLAKLAAQGLTLVRVHPKGATLELPRSSLTVLGGGQP